MEGFKKCCNPKCKSEGELLPLSEFYNRARNKDGLETRCKRCIQAAGERNRLKIGRQYKHYEWESMLVGPKPIYYFLKD